MRSKTTIGVILIVSIFAIGLSCKKSSSKKPRPPYTASFTTVPANGTLVNTPFNASIIILDAATGLPATLATPLDVTMESAVGSGALTGTLVIMTTNPSVTFTGLSYDAIDTVELRVKTPKSPSATSVPVRFDVDILANPNDLGAVAPSTSIPTVDFSLIDGLAAPYTVTGTPLDWSLIDGNGGAVVDSGSELFGGTSTATVSLNPISTESGYLLTANLRGSLNLSNVELAITSLTIQNTPGPFVALKSARVGQAYMDDVSFAVTGVTEWRLLSGSLPNGLSLDTATGVIAGVPTTPISGSFRIAAVTAPTLATPIRCALAVFSQNESEWTGGQDFGTVGPLATMLTNDSTTFTSSFDGSVYTTALQIHHPDLAAVTTPLPLYVHHRGRGFNFRDYDNLLGHIASYGFICVTVEDYQSFFSPAAPSPNSFYDISRADAGMESGSAFHEGAIQHMLTRNTTPADPFMGKIDPSKVFVGGHSRGGGATHGSHVRGLDLQINGAIYFMAFDLRFFGSTIPPGVLPSYGIPDIQPRLPNLLIMAENDSDLRYPYADQIIERASGPTTSVTVYGAKHNYLGDTNPAEFGSPAAYISRIDQQRIIFNQVVAFLKRWSDLDLSLEGFLYGNEFVGSTEVGVASYRNMVEAVLIDDFQDGDPSMNSLGGMNTFTGGTRQETDIYPLLGSFGSLGMQNSIFIFASPTASYLTELPPGTDISGRERLIFRCGQTSASGYDAVTLQVRLTDAAAQSTTVTLFDRAAPSTTYLPDFQAGDPRFYDRFVEVQVPMSDFAAANPAVNLDTIGSVELLFDFAFAPPVSNQIYIDDLRFE
ncbi:MAG: putative Ig domain-containing protein [Planctomycetota bacterium]|nr:putative Ig domain-containing protein [Planctomycetota bacterium]